METFNGNQIQPSDTVVNDIYRNENENNCFLREDYLIDFSNLVSGLNIDNTIKNKEEFPISRDTSETESATEEVEELDIKLIGDDVIIFQTEEDMKQSYPNLQIYNETQNTQQTLAIVDDLNSDIKNDFKYSSVQYQEANAVQSLGFSVPLEKDTLNESKVLNIQAYSESTIDSNCYYIDSFPLTKNPPDIACDSNYDENNLEGSYTVGESSSSVQSTLCPNISKIDIEETNEIEHFTSEKNDNNIVIISMKKFFVDQVSKQPLERPATSILPSHKWKRLYECFQCGKKFSHSVNLRIHMEVHTNELHPHKCVQCGVSFAKSRQLLRHLKKHTAPKKKNLNCPICEATYKTYGHLRHHLIVVHGVENVNPALSQSSAPKSSSAQVLIVKPKKPYCSSNFVLIPSKTFSENDITNGCKIERSSLKNNKENVTKDLLECPVCSKIYKSRGSFKKHVMLHNEEEYNEAQTDLYDEKIWFKSEKKEHEIIRATEELIPSKLGFICSICGLHFKNFFAMIKHKKNSHRSFRCSKKSCKAQFSHKHLLDRHVSQSHSMTHFINHFKCRTCASYFTSKSILNLHQRAYFPFGKPYRCAKCFTNMIIKSNLERRGATPESGEPEKE